MTSSLLLLSTFNLVPNLVLSSVWSAWQVRATTGKFPPKGSSTGDESRYPYRYPWSLALPGPQPQQPDKGDKDNFLASRGPETYPYSLCLAAGAGARGGPETKDKDKAPGSEVSSIAGWQKAGHRSPPPNLRSRVARN